MKSFISGKPQYFLLLSFLLLEKQHSYKKNFKIIANSSAHILTHSFICNSPSRPDGKLFYMADGCVYAVLYSAYFTSYYFTEHIFHVPTIVFLAIKLTYGD